MATDSTKSGFKKTIFASFGATVLGADADFIIGKVPFDGIVESVTIVPVAALAGANTNTRKHTVTNRALDGLGVVKVAELQYNAGVSLVAFDEKTLTNEVAANLVVVKDQILSLASTHVGTGIADGGGQVFVKIRRT